MIKLGLAGKYKVSKFKAGEEPKEIAEFSNLITDWGLRYQGLKDIPTNICIGSSATTPNVADSDLKGFLYQENTTNTSGYFYDENEPEWYKYSICEATFAPKNVNYVVREIGFGRVANTGIYSRSITKDLDGNPTDIVVLADEYLRVTYELRAYFATNPVEVNFTPSGDDITVKKALIGAYFRTDNVASYAKILDAYVNAYKDAKEIGKAHSSFDMGGRNITPYNLKTNLSMDATGFGMTSKIHLTVSEWNSSNLNAFFFSMAGSTRPLVEPKVFLPVGFKKTNEDVAEFALHISWGRK